MSNKRGVYFISSELTPNRMYFDQTEEMKYVYMLEGRIRPPAPQQYSSTNKHPSLNTSQHSASLCPLLRDPGSHCQGGRSVKQTRPKSICSLFCFFEPFWMCGKRLNSLDCHPDWDGGPFCVLGGVTISVVMSICTYKIFSLALVQLSVMVGWQNCILNICTKILIKEQGPIQAIL